VISLFSRGLMYDQRLPGSDVVRKRLDEVIAKANRERITIYTMSPTEIDNLGGASMPARGRTVPGRLSDVSTRRTVQDIDSLQHLASETGGRAIYATNDVRIGFAQVLEENRGYYLLGFNPGAESAGRPHKVKVNVKRPGLKVQARATAYTKGTQN
jgi:VWFA-related protein